MFHIGPKYLFVDVRYGNLFVKLGYNEGKLISNELEYAVVI